MEHRSPENNKTKKILILRLSSLGDIILSAACLSVENLNGAAVDWVVATDFEFLLKGHPRLNRVFSFNRKNNFLEWLKLCHRLLSEDYDEIVDLHKSIRTRLFYFFYVFNKIIKNRKTKWKSFSKSRWRLWGYYLFKSKWPKKFKPHPRIKLFSKTLDGTGTEKPSLLYLAQEIKEWSSLKTSFQGKKIISIMPSSKWSFKEWSSDKYFEWAQRNKEKYFYIIHGQKSDLNSQKLVDLFKHGDCSYFSGVGKWTLNEVAFILLNSDAYLGSDTGLAHLAEAVGTPSWVIFGPTVPEMGFGPWKNESRSIQKKVWCQPCGKDGRYCYRFLNRHLCLRNLSVDEVEKQL